MANNIDPVNARNESKKSHPSNTKTREEILKQRVKLQDFESGKDVGKKVAKNKKDEDDARGNREPMKINDDMPTKRSETSYRN